MFSLKEVFILIGIALLVGITWYFAQQNPKPLPSREEVEQELLDLDSWQTYRNDVYHFVVKYPGEWEVAESDDSIVPMITVMKPGEKGVQDQPLDHFENRTHVSVYPRGIPTEGIFAQRKETNVDFAYQTEQANDLTLKSGEIWATEARFSAWPESWGPSGFIWGRGKIDGLAVDCIRGENSLSDKDCDPLFGDVLVRDGAIDPSDRIIIAQILESFRFLDPQKAPAAQNGAMDIITIATPESGDRVRSPLRIRGEARGTWFFEGDFPAKLYDANGELIAEGPVTAQESWMTTEFVPFSGTLTFDRPDTAVGTLVLEKANPSGLPEHAAERTIEIAF